ncbi:SDR family oxidoreductase [Nocardia pseudobrasiliensis]|uniref:NADP-dependent 3-hydroxy acid dehydrogenase YdfG n=1 Tax=Nocardia pseudobrasiliensis TaxID=45979 RepID=A0A370I7R6_9NOCA|nr:SDR family oxidoreductase [Nocardia pseudobrasiliensis]RDI66748.1 NADP-dependent 3-hydroxy acid dehydrogenase YdfG [Nocardia pseudobrasiliensis]
MRDRLKSVSGKKTLITGAASGIGRATALAAARAGAELVLTDIDAEGLADTVETIGREGGKVLVSRALDISDYEAVREFAEEVHSRHGSLDVVMNIAGVSAWGTVENLEHRHWRRLVDVNLMGPIHIIETFVPPMVRAGRGGALVNVSSAAGLLAFPWHAAYSASKYGLRGASEVLRFDLERHGITVHLVVPGAVNTGLVDTVEIAGVDRDDPRIQRYTKRFQQHAAPPEKVAGQILRGIEKNRFMIHTSFEVRFGYWWARKFAWPYEFAMRRANDLFNSFLR